MMSAELNYSELSVGDEIKPLIKAVNTVNITMYISAVWLMDRIHFDYQYAVHRRGLPNIVAPGNMACDYYTQLLTDWAGTKGTLRRLSVQYRHFMTPGNTLTCGGKIVAKREENGVGLVDLDLWIRNEDGVMCVPGSATVAFPLNHA